MRWINSLCVATILAAAAGCEVDSWLNPAVVGRWEPTPTVVPILEQLDVIDEQPAKAPGTTTVAPKDLVENVHEYVVGSGDLLTFTIFELIMPNIETVQTRRVDELGMVRLPVLGALKVRGATPSQIEHQISSILQDMDVVKDAEVSVVIQEGRQATYSVLGEPRIGSTGIGTYTIPHPNFRLMEAMALARGIPGRTKTIYIIRSANFVQPRMGMTPSIRVNQEAYNSAAPTGDSQKLGLINSLTEGIDPDLSAPSGDPMGLLGGALNGNGHGGGEPKWIYRDGQWTKIDPMLQEAAVVGGHATPTDGGISTTGAKSALPYYAGIHDQNLIPVDDDGNVGPMIPRIVEIPYARLLEGDMRYNVVIRPGDVIRVPAPLIGNVYIMGSISRPGTYALPGDKDLTLKQLVAAAGNLSQIAIPERVDLTRRVTDNREATVRLNLREIFNGTQPDFYLKPNDLINIGTNFLATPLAVVRNGFRMTYGFGFVLDRNFEEEVFGNLTN